MGCRKVILRQKRKSAAKKPNFHISHQHYSLASACSKSSFLSSFSHLAYQKNVLSGRSNMIFTSPPQSNQFKSVANSTTLYQLLLLVFQIISFSPQQLQAILSVCCLFWFALSKFQLITSERKVVQSCCLI